MKTEQIIKKIESIPGGRFFRVRYVTKVPLAADAVKSGISIIKIVDTTTRTGVKYSNIEGVNLSDDSENKTSRTNNWEWVVKNRIKHNTKTGKNYLVIAPIGKGSHTVVSYIKIDSDGNTTIIDENAVRVYTTSSYWRNKKPTIINVTLENVLLVK